MSQSRNGKLDQYKPVAPKGSNIGADRPLPKDAAIGRSEAGSVSHHDDDDISIEELYRVNGGEAGGA